MISRMFAKITSPAIGAVITKAIKKLPTALGITVYGSLTAGMIYSNQREHDVKAKKFEADCSDLVKNDSEFEIIGEPNHGSLTSKIVRDTKTGNEYVKKTAHGRRYLVEEFMISNFLHAIRKDQPECLIMQTENESGTHFHTLSYKDPGSQDLDNFIRSGRVNELKNKKVTGLEESLAADHIVGKQSDIILANLVIRETNQEFKISTIDNERAICPGIEFLHFGQISFPTDPSTLLGDIHDLDIPSDDNRSGLAGDAQAKEFGNIARNIMTSKKITDYYAKVAQADIDPLIHNCYRLAAHSTLFKSKECAQYHDLFRRIQNSAAEHATPINRS